MCVLRIETKRTTLHVDTETYIVSVHREQPALPLIIANAFSSTTPAELIDGSLILTPPAAARKRVRQPR
ncbi:MAG: hypothetical protein ACXV2E_05315 [Halobacteriota archaeon]